ncbi:MAG: DUF1232 domain-containing protein [Anaerovibrio sp.]|uniref:YkvA family protein n=1 Tax=Anaerovibrio sp. TaxID=1872532 RepID=UPI0025D8B459|nr:YkvA family protein [Anaerovibrio sp.]MCR5177140.1 DUF1232 domain-containing protein [Anaerovibrio sp.]
MKNIKNKNLFEDTNVPDENYIQGYSEEGLWEKITKYVSKIGLALIYKALQLHYVVQSPNCPPKVKVAILAALGYLISPIDAILDFTPVVGYTDDAAAISAALVIAQMYITEEIKTQARNKICEIFGSSVLDKLEKDMAAQI